MRRQTAGTLVRRRHVRLLNHLRTWPLLDQVVLHLHHSLWPLHVMLHLHLCVMLLHLLLRRVVHHHLLVLHRCLHWHRL